MRQEAILVQIESETQNVAEETKSTGEEVKAAMQYSLGSAKLKWALGGLAVGAGAGLLCAGGIGAIGVGAASMGAAYLIGDRATKKERDEVQRTQFESEVAE